MNIGTRRTWVWILFLGVLSFRQVYAVVPNLAVLVDVSGSMAHNDPNGERIKALRLLVQLIPEGSNFSLWAFATQPEPLIQLRAVKNADRTHILEHENRIDNHGAWTDIDAALLDGMHELEKSPSTEPRHLILLTDGFVELGHGPEADKASRERVWGRTQEALAQHIHIHTIDLGGKADDALLRHLSLGSEGRFVSANQDRLTKAFLQIFDVAAPQQRIPLHGRQFSVDSGIRELTLLLFRPQHKNDPSVELQAPDGTRTSFAQHDDSVRWVHTDTYDLMTLAHPAAGVWTISQDPGADSRVTILSDLSVQVSGVPTNMAVGGSLHLKIHVSDKDKVVTDPNVLDLTTISEVHGGVGQLWPQPSVLYDGPSQGSVMVPDDGIFHEDTQSFDHAGDYVIRVLLKSPTFMREFDQLMHVTSDTADLPHPAVRKPVAGKVIPVKTKHVEMPMAIWKIVVIGLLIALSSGGLGFVGYVMLHKTLLRMRADRKKLESAENDEDNDQKE